LEKEMITMMGKMMEQMNEVQTDVKEIKTEMNVMNVRMDSMESKFDARFNEVDARFDKVDTEIVELKNEVRTGFYGVGKHFEVLAENIIEVEKESKSDVNHLRHKISQMEKDIYMLTPKQ